LIKVIFISHDGTNRTECDAEAGQNILDIAHANDIEMEGACEGNMACSTCHVIVADDWYARLNPPQLEEEEMLDLAPGLCATSRLGCQIEVTTEMDGLTLRLPKETLSNSGW